MSGGLRRMWQAVKRPAWAWDVGVHGRPHQLGNVAPVLGKNTGLEDFFAWMRNNFDPTVSWRDLDFIRERWNGPLIIKGILDAEDARAAAELGADGIVVSNHGGRQLDGVPSTAHALPAIADAAGDKLTVLADGGVRSGLDVVRMPEGTQSFGSDRRAQAENGRAADLIFAETKGRGRSHGPHRKISRLLI